jgi:hypothetical protein
MKIKKFGGVENTVSQTIEIRKIEHRGIVYKNLK